jgi:hypothetical protein
MGRIGRVCLNNTSMLREGQEGLYMFQVWLCCNSVSTDGPRASHHNSRYKRKHMLARMHARSSWCSRACNVAIAWILNHSHLSDPRVRVRAFPPQRPGPFEDQEHSSKGEEPCLFPEITACRNFRTVVMHILGAFLGVTAAKNPVSAGIISSFLTSAPQ